MKNTGPEKIDKSKVGSDRVRFILEIDWHFRVHANSFVTYANLVPQWMLTRS